MAGAFIGGAALGAGFGELLTFIKKTGERAINFYPVLKETQSKIEAIIPLIEEIDSLNEALEFPKEEIEKLRDLLETGKKLLLRCVELRKIDYLRKSSYTQKLREWNTKIGSSVDVLSMQMARDVKKTMMIASEIKDVVQRIESNSGLSNQLRNVDLTVPQCKVPEIREDSVGLDKPVEKLKAKLFRDGVRLLVVTAPGGCGKTTLALKFCHDKQVKSK